MADKTDRPTIHWDDEAILTAAGTTPNSVRRLLRRHAQTLPTDGAVYQWASRKWLPNGFRAILTYCLLAESKIAPHKMYRVGSPRRTAPVRDAYPGQKANTADVG